MNRSKHSEREATGSHGVTRPLRLQVSIAKFYISEIQFIIAYSIQYNTSISRNLNQTWMHLVENLFGYW